MFIFCKFRKKTYFRQDAKILKDIDITLSGLTNALFKPDWKKRAEMRKKIFEPMGENICASWHVFSKIYLLYFRSNELN